jgi:presenilin-like A22 family membrane protease
MLKNILEGANEVLSFIAVVSGIALAIIIMFSLGVRTIALISTCSLVLSIGISYTLKKINKQKDSHEKDNV